MGVVSWLRRRRGPCSPPDASTAGRADSRRPGSSSPASFSFGATAGTGFAVAGLLLALSGAPAAADGSPGSNPGNGSHREIAYPEGGAVRVLTLPALAHERAQPGGWRLSGPDAARFRIEAGALRFAGRPDFEAPGDAGGDNRYEAALHRDPAGNADAGTLSDTLYIRVSVRDRDEPGRATLRPSRPMVGAPLTVSLTDPDRGDTDPAPTVRWERWRSPGVWQAIPDAAGLTYTPTPADAGRTLRAVLIYADRHGPGRRAMAELPHPVIGPVLSALDARTDSGRAAAEGGNPQMLRPAFDPRILHYGLNCAERDVMTVSFAAPPDVRVSINGIQPRMETSPGSGPDSMPEGAAAVTVAPDSDVAVTVAAPDGAYTTYTLHCMPGELWALRPEPDPARPLDVLLAVAAGPWAAVIDEHGVSRAHVRAEDSPTAGMFLRPFGGGPGLRWAHAGLPEGGDGGAWRWTVRDRELRALRRVTTGAPLTATGRHDFRLLDDGSALLMAYEPAVRDLSALPFPDREGKPFGAAVEMEDSVIQLVGPDGAVRWTWNSFGRIPLEDCTQHWFPNDWAHVNSLQWTDEGVLASFRGCSAVLMIDPAAPPGEEIVWRLGASNLAPGDWQRRGLGPPPLRIVGDPEGAFCGQHAAQLLPPPEGLTLPRLLLFDNGVACVTDPHTGKPLGRRSGVYSRAVEYALDLEHGEAVFLRDHALGNGRDMLGYALGHVDPLRNGDWLVSWGGRGRASADRAGGNPPSDIVTRVDPGTGREGFRIPAADDAASVRALPVSPLALLRAPGPLDAVLPDAAPAGHAGAGDRVEIAVAFSRPVAAFGPETGSVEVTGGTLAAVLPLTGFGRPAHAWRLVLAPSGDGPLELRFRAGLACAGETAADEAAARGTGPGICTADGTRLGAVPGAMRIPPDRSPGQARITNETARQDRAADAGTRDPRQDIRTGAKR